MEDNATFAESSRRWRALAGTMGATYIMWDSSLLESLVRQKFPEYWGLYQRVRYPVQRVDMGRLFVLLTYGGLFSDLDVFPNRTSYEQCWMAVLRVERPKQSWKTTANDVAHSRTDQKAAHSKRTAIKRPSLSSREFV